MSDFVTHGLVGAGVCAAPVKVLGKYVAVPAWVKPAAVVYGFLSGIWPDVGDWLMATLGLYPRWVLYVYYHRDADWWWLINPGFFFHVKIMDPPFHIISGWNWWSVMWSVEILWILFAFSLLFYVFKVEIDILWFRIKMYFGYY